MKPEPFNHYMYNKIDNKRGAFVVVIVWELDL